MDDIWSSIDYLLKKKSIKYDIIFFDVIHTSRFSPHFLDLNDWLPQEHMDLYSNEAANQLCNDNGKWIGLVCISFLFFNII